MSSIDGSVKAESRFKKGLKYSWEGGKAVLATKVGTALVGLDAVLSGGAFALGATILKKIKKKPVSLLQTMREYTKGAVMGTIGSGMYDAIGATIPNIDVYGNIDWSGAITRAVAIIGPGNMAFNAAYMPVNRIVDNDYNPVHIIDDFKNEYMPLNKKSWKYLSAPLAATANGAMGGYAGMIGVDAGYNLLANMKQEKKVA